ncbi:MAG TPA: hypothetical protein VGB04_02920 [Allosphingosinicella sp.]|jgi:hypothetical protein
MAEGKLYDQATKVDARDGKVSLDGPDGVAVLMTPAAAEETSDRLLWGAAKAQGQIVQREAREAERKSREPKDETQV